MSAFLFASVVSCGGSLAPGGRAESDKDASVDAAMHVVQSGLGADSGPETPAPTTPADAAVPLDARLADDGDDVADPLSRCSGDRDIYYIDVEGPQGPLSIGEQTYTNLDTNWYVYAKPGELELMLEAGSGPAGSIQIWTSSGPPVPGTYPQGASNTGPAIEIADYSEGCTVTSGSFTLVELAYEADGGTGAGNVTSLLLSYDLLCGGDRLRGCVRYSL